MPNWDFRHTALTERFSEFLDTTALLQNMSPFQNGTFTPFPIHSQPMKRFSSNPSLPPTRY